MTAQKEELPKYENGDWTCPEGYAWPKCPGCGHICYGRRPLPMLENKAVKGALCEWCVDEM